MAGYSGTPLWKKLGMKPGRQWALVDAPVGLEIEDSPSETKHAKTVPKDFDGLLLFAKTRKSLDRAMSKAVNNMHAEASVWIAWPKKSSKIDSELDFDYVQRAGLDANLVDNKVCAVDENWSGLRFVVRTHERANWRS